MSDNSSNNYDCPICGSFGKDIVFYGISDCNHSTCGTCAIKLSLFSHSKTQDDVDYSKCVICKNEAAKTIITRKIEDFNEISFENLEFLQGYGLYFQDEVAKNFYQDTVKIECLKCKHRFNNIDDLADHVVSHKLRYCELCLEFHKCLPSEYPLYTNTDYHNHRNKIHPKCKFCDNRFYDNSHLIKHVKKEHFLCDICHRSRGFVAYKSQQELLNHYFKDHFVCEICRSSNHVNVFDSEYNLKMHRVSEHNRSGLVKEGLVNLTFSDFNGDSTRNYGRNNRRNNQTRNQTEDVLDELQMASVVPPEIECEKEFPRLGERGSTQDSNERGLGNPSSTQDSNDARRAFDLENGASNVVEELIGEENNCAEPISELSGDKTTMADNFALSVKRSQAKYSEKDFPALATGQISNNLSSDISYKSTIKPSTANSKRIIPGTNKSKVTEEDYPALSNRKNVETNSQGSWGVSNHTTTASTAPKVQIVSSNSRNINTQPIRQSIPSSDDFPALSKPANTQINPPKWGKSNQKSNVMKNNLTNKSHVVPFATTTMKTHPTYINNGTTKLSTKETVGNNEFNNDEVRKPDSLKGFDYIPSVQPSKESLKVLDANQFKNLKTNNTNSNDNPRSNFSINYESDFPVALTSSAKGSILTSSSVPKLSYFNNNKQKLKPKNVPTKTKNKPTPVNEKPTPVLEEIIDTSVINGPRKPTALKGINYIPSTVAPTKDSLKFLDASEFKNIKSSSKNVLNTEPDFSINDQDEFPAMNVPLHVSDQCSNNATKMSYGKTAKNPNTPRAKQEEEPAKPLNVDSSNEFPDLSSLSLQNNKKYQISNPTSQKNSKNKSKSKVKKIEKKVEPSVVVEKPESVFCLSDAACSVLTAGETASYTPSPEFEQLNQALQTYLTSNLENEVATHILALSSKYRHRLITANDFVKQIQTQTKEIQDHLKVIMPIMVTLLPEIPLQRALMQSLQSKFLNCNDEVHECIMCGQILLHDDIEYHNSAAHP